MSQERRNPEQARKPGLGDIAVGLPEGSPVRRILGRAADMSEFGIGITIPLELKIGAVLTLDGVVETEDNRRPIHCDGEVRWCVDLGSNRYRVGLQLREIPKAPADSEMPGFDYYEALQLSQQADLDTIHRVYRLLAARYHPDNIETGNTEMFRKVTEAHRVLSDPERRAAYDANYRLNTQVRWKIFDSVSVTVGSEAEKRKRKGMLSLLYAQRMQQAEHGALSLREMEELLGCPREHLEFTVWYLKESGLIRGVDNARYQITIKGVDYLETTGSTKIDESHLLASA